VQHPAIFDYVALSASPDGRVTEYVEHLHEHLVEPCVIREGAYVLPSAPGYSAEMHSELPTYAFPTGTYGASTDRPDLVP